MWPKLAGILFLGYLVMTRSFAYVGLPRYHIFIGEVVLAAFLLAKPEAWLKHWPGALIHRTPLSAMAWALLLFFEYGVFQVLRGVYLGYPALAVLEEFVFNYYPLFLFLGLWVGMRRPQFLRRIVGVLAWSNGLYGIAYIFFLNRSGGSIPGASVPIFGQPAGSALAMMGLLLVVRQPRRIWFPLLLNAFVLLGVQVRGEWLAFVVALLVWTLLSKRLGRAMLVAGTVAALVCVGYFAHFEIPAPMTRGGSISAQAIIARAIAPVNLKIADELAPDAPKFAGTVAWREHWWAAIWESVHSNATSALFGKGYGYPLSDLVSYLESTPLRTPHCVFFYALAYGGWLGVVTFFLFQGTLAALLLQVYRKTGQPFGLVVWAMLLAEAAVGNFFETPFGAIPFYLLAGLCLAPLLKARSFRSGWASAPSPAVKEPTRGLPLPA